MGLLLIGAILALDLWLLHLLIVHSIRPQQISFWTFLGALVVSASVPVLLMLIYQTTGCLTLRYYLDRNGIVVRWLGAELTFPIGDIQRIVPGRQLGDPIVRRCGLRWPGHERGMGMVPSIGQTQFLATRPLTEQLLLITPGQATAISPHDLQGFLNAFRARQELGPNRLLQEQVHRAPWLSWPFWTDQTAWILLAAAAVINLSLFAYLCARFPGLDFQLTLHFDSLGQPDRIGTKIELFALPIIGLIILGANLGLGLLLYKRERAGSYLLWGAAAAVQVLFWLAAFSIVP